MNDKSLLLADDSLPSLLATKAMLEKLGYAVTTAQSGSEALARAQEHTFATILLDEYMPEMNGSDITRYLRDHTTPNSNSLIYALTGAVEEEEHTRILNSGVNGLINKPVNSAKLEAILLKRKADIDSQIVVDLINDLGEDSAKRLVGIFLKELNSLCNQLEQATPDNLEAEIKAVSHILKNSATLYGANTLADYARELNEQNDITPASAKLLCSLCKQTIQSIEESGLLEKNS